MEVDAQNISIHRGDLTGPVIATADSFQGKDGITEIAMLETEAVVPIRHRHHSLPLMHGSTYFRVDGKQMQWKKHKELVDDNGNVLARFEGATEGGEGEKVGRVVLTGEGGERADLAVITCLIDQERADEGKYSVWGSRRCFANCNRNLRMLALKVKNHPLVQRDLIYSLYSFTFVEVLVLTCIFCAPMQNVMKGQCITRDITQTKKLKLFSLVQTCSRQHTPYPVT